MSTSTPESEGLHVRYTIVEAAHGLLTKRIRLDERGEIEKRAAASPASGTFRQIESVGTAEEILAELEKVFSTLTARQALIAVPLPVPLAPDGNLWRLRRFDDKGLANALPRTRETFQPLAGAALGFLDIDVPPALRSSIVDAIELYEKILLPACPCFADVALLVRPSVSSGVKLVGTDNPRPSGFHVYFVISDGYRLGDLAAALFSRLALGGHAVVEASRSGSMLRRALVDVSASKGGERLIFEADPDLEELGLERVARSIVRFPGDVMDVEAALAWMALSQSDMRKLDAIWTLAEEDARGECDAARERWIADRAGQIMQRGDSPEVAMRTARKEILAFDAGELWDDFQIRLDSGAIVTVDEILRDPQRFKGKRAFSLDESKPQRGKGFIWPFWCAADPETGRPAGPYFSSFEHGGRYWRLRSSSVEDESVGARLGEKPVLSIGADYAPLAEKIELAIVAAGLPVYSKASRLVRPVRLEAAGWCLVEIDVHMMRQIMEEAVTFIRSKVRSKPPEEIARLLLSRSGCWPYGEVTAISNSPTIDVDGKLIASEGHFDRASGLLLLGLPAMPEGFADTLPTRADALKAIDILKDELLGEFAFDGGFDGASFSVALSGLITPLVRLLVRPAPIHGNSAPAAGSGKSYLVSLASAIATGRDCTFISASVTAEETEKKLVGALLKGGPFVVLDNLSRVLSSDLLCQAATQEYVEYRALGGSGMITVRQRSTVYVNGNNLTIAEDLTRRVIMCRLDLGEERPELHRYENRPFERILADRGRYIAACLTIVRAYIVAGFPGRLDPIASFEPWSNFVRSALVWLNCADPCRTMDQVRDDDPVLQQIRAIFAAWPALGQWFTTAQLIKRGTEDRDAVGGGQLWDALFTVCGGQRGDNLIPKRLGEYLSAKCVGKVATVPDRWLEPCLEAVQGSSGLAAEPSTIQPVTVKFLKTRHNRAIAAWCLEAVR